MQRVLPFKPTIFVLTFVVGIVILAPLINTSDYRRGGFTAFLVSLTVVLLVAPVYMPAELKARLHRLKVPAIIAGSALLSWYLFGINLQAEFGVIDDHEIMYFAGPGRPESLSEAWSLLLETEVGNPGGFPRYRPSYYAIRIGEALVWGMNPFLWYLARLVMAAAFMSVFWFLLEPHFGFIIGGLALLFVFAYGYWGDIFARLGPAEAYAAFGTSIFALGWTHLRRTSGDSSTRQALWGWTLLTIGALIPIGAKENFLILLVPVAIAAHASLRKRNERLIALMGTTIITVYSLFISWAVVTALTEIGVTIRAEPITLSSRAAVALDALGAPFSLFMLATLAAMTAIRNVARRRFEHTDLHRIASVSQWAVGGCFILYLSQVIFYNGDWPVGFRYDFPGALYKPLFFLSLAWFLSRSLQVVKEDNRYYAGFKYGMIVSLVLAIPPAGFESIREVGNHNVRGTQAFTAQLDAVILALDQNPGAALVLESHHPLDYEQIYSWPRFLRANQIASPLFLRLHGYSETTVVLPRQKMLSQLLERASKEGDQEIGPIRELENFSDKCFSLHLSGRTATECTDLN